MPTSTSLSLADEICKIQFFFFFGGANLNTFGSVGGEGFSFVERGESEDEGDGRDQKEESVPQDVRQPKR